MDLPEPDDRNDVLAQPTRRRVFALLVELGGRAYVDDLAAGLDMHPNGVRVHLSHLLDAGLVTRRPVRRGPGRPRDQWAVAPAARPGGEPPESYRPLARWLAAAIPTTPERLNEVESAGRTIGRTMKTPADATPGEVIVDALAAAGFQPQVTDGDEEHWTCRLTNCPYRESAVENPHVVCALHRGITLGLLDQVAPSATLERFVPHRPDEAGCEIAIAGLESSVRS
jgi:predicted ArsR family transcriptional regulator